LVDQPVNLFDQSDIFGALIATATAAFERFEQGKLLFPIPQNMLFYAKSIADLADRAQGAFVFAVFEFSHGLNGVSW
jgi:hypothetical protein